MSPMILLHLAASLIALFAILAVMLLPKGRAAHRFWGRIGAAGLVAAALSSFGITSNGGFSWIHLLSVITLVNVPLAILAARSGRIVAHRRAMLINAGSLVIAGFFAVIVPGRLLHTTLFG
jgi:uncharacterized membrane protein